MASILIEREKNGEFPEQKSVEWLDARYNMITASEIASILDCNIYESSYDLLLRKLKPVEELSNSVLEWGIMFEPIAIEFYQFSNEKVYPVGLVTHPKYSWLGASPDGVLLSNKLLEIKCPRFRKIGGKIPLYYWIQMQIQMEVCDMDTCIYNEFEFYLYKDIIEYENDIECKYVQNTMRYKDETKHYKFIGAHLETVKRDKKWFVDNVKKMKDFFDKILHYRSLKDGIKQLKIDSRKYHKRKRSTGVYTNKKSKTDNFINWDNWVSATRIRNYMIDDPLIDYLNIYNTGVQTDQYSNTFQSYIMKQGITFEETIIKKFLPKFSKHIVNVANYQQAKSHDKYLETVNYMKRGIPIIYQGVLHDYDRKLFGIPDLLIRSDWINKIFGMGTITDSKKSGLNPGYHYRVFEIKFTSLHLCSDGKHLRNSNKTILANKGQTYIYNKILGSIQNHTPKKTYIIGKKWFYNQGQDYFEGNSFEKVAHINFSKNDKFIRGKTAKAIKWIRNLNKNGSSWILNPPSVKELKPNMCNIDDKWQQVKKQISRDTNDITELWMCGVVNRESGEKNGVKNWRTHKNLTSDLLGVTGDKVAPTLQLFIDMNQTINNSCKLITPSKLQNNMFNWRKKTLEFFVDFETIIPEIYEAKHTFIFMIGVGVILHGNWEFKCFIAKDLSLKSEKKVLLDFHDYIKSFGKKNKRLWHWGSAEDYLYRNAINRHTDIIKKVNLITDWCDMLKMFKFESIICRGMLNFSLKSVVKAFCDNMFIETNYSSDVSNGLQAMVAAYECYENENANSYVMKNIQDYNEVDCKVMLEIIEYLRNNL
jgi:putative phage-type endonuclease